MTDLAVGTAQLCAALWADATSAQLSIPVLDRIRDIGTRLQEPLHLAVVGRTKAGKSTLINALVGQRLAPTDAGECTRLLTWYRFGPVYRLLAHRADRRVIELPFSHGVGGMRIDPVELAAADPAWLEVQWPSSALSAMTVIDTPGLSSATAANSRRTIDFLEGGTAVAGSGPPPADVVLYLMKHMHQQDAAYLESLDDGSSASPSAAAALAVISRADEIGGALPGSMASAARIARRYEADPRVRALCGSVVPFAGLLAETARTVTEAEVGTLRALTALEPAQRSRQLLSADLFIAAATLHDPVADVPLRRQLVERFGIFGLRAAVEKLTADPALTTSELSTALLELANLPALQHAVAATFASRSSVLKARTALAELRRLQPELAHRPDIWHRLSAGLERLEATGSGFLEIRLLDLVAQLAGVLGTSDADALVRLGSTGTPRHRLGLPDTIPDAEIGSAAQPFIDRWRTRADDPLGSAALHEAADHAVQLAERAVTRR